MLRSLLLVFALFANTALVAANHVSAVLFYSGRCPHCHEVIKEVLPPLLEKYEQQFEVIFVNIATHLGGEIYHDTIEALEIPQDRMGVPTLLIGDHYLVGSNEIEEDLPSLVHKDLLLGGVPMPTIPGLQEALEENEHPEEKQVVTKRTPPITIATEANLKEITKQTLIEKLGNDLLGNSLALVMIAGLIISLIWVPIRWKHAGFKAYAPTQPNSYWLPLLALGGMAISIYMTYIETKEMPAVCGPIGNCNAVQQSPYAYLFGIPVGLLGVVGYAAILLTWISPFFIHKFPQWILPILLYGASLFSLYLTILEPFAIGAACIWCLTSALITVLMLWSSVKHGY